MNKPTKSIFMSHEYSIVYSDKVVVEGVGDAYGSCDHTKQEIEIQRGMRPSKERAVLLHEVLHQLFNHGIELPDDLEEKVVTWLGDALGSHIDGNRELWAYLTRDTKRTRK